MGDAVGNGLSWLTGKLADHASVTCALQSGQSAAISVRVTLGKSQVEIPDAHGAQVIVEVRTATVPAADLGAYRPRNGDRLTGTGVDCEVAAPGGHGAASWAWADGHRQRIKIFLRDHDADRPTG